MTSREPITNVVNFDNDVSYVHRVIVEDEVDISNPDSGIVNFHMAFYHNFKHHFDLLLLLYSQGAPIADMQEEFPFVVNSLERFLAHPQHVPFNFTKRLDDYVKGMWLVSLALLLGVDSGLFYRLLKCLGNEGQDALFEKLVSTRFTGRPAAPGLLYPKAYQPLLDAATAAPGQQAGPMRRFLGAWYRNMKPTYWHDNHKGQDGGGFFGYWCWEAAAVSVAFDTDDLAYRDLPYYPQDMAAFGRKPRA